ncbi:hypothetical protein [Micromonospora aurantiaca (nom. illeg.)]|uniref:hypothetical protein n=1 Tax=Micromonospora aurantiaca (nom. illeg.) TaxID=47850 RepID=UPI001611344E
MLAGLEMPPAIEAEQCSHRPARRLRSGRTEAASSTPCPEKARKSGSAGPSGWLLPASRCFITAKTNEQADNVIDRPAKEARERHIGLLSPADCQPSERVKGHERGAGLPPTSPTSAAPPSSSAQPPTGPGPSKIFAHGPLDEAYQPRPESLLRLAGRVDRALFVSDGRLDLFSNPSAEPLSYIFNTSSRSGEGGWKLLLRRELGGRSNKRIRGLSTKIYPVRAWAINGKNA